VEKAEPTREKVGSEDMAMIVAVCRSHKRGVSKTPIDEGFFEKDYGLVDDAHAASDTHRQVSLLALDSIEKMRRLGLELSVGDFAENLTVEGLCLVSLPIGTRLAVGKDVILEVTEIGKKYYIDSPILYQGKNPMLKEGIFAKIIKGGAVKAGDKLEVMGDNG
jgi:MOSC domain-containing protein YiiM